MRTLDIWYPVISADKKEIIRWMLRHPACLLGADDELPSDAERELLPDPGVQDLLDDGPVFLELLADEDAMLRDAEDEGDPAFGSQ
eukprot:7790167-Pyramimonas_sp.AAC.1